MDKRIHYLIGIDTETTNGFDDDLSQSLCYDIGWCICDKQGRIYAERSFVVYEIFTQMPELMEIAHYANKIPQYQKEIESGTRILTSLDTIHRFFLQDCETWNVDTCFAHNAAFDLHALNNTIRYLTQSRQRYFFPLGMEIHDTMRMAREVIAKQKSYRSFCETYDYFTKTGRPRITAEILTRYLRGNNSFEESHTGLEDVRIETALYAHCVRQHKKMEKRLFPNREKPIPWPNILVWKENKLNTISY